MGKIKHKYIDAAVIFIVTVICVTIFSKSSPLYPLNDWVDSNCFFTVGKSMANGKILYKDIYEQKGILLYVFHSLAYYISNTTFLGVYIFEIISGFIFLYFSFKTAKLYIDRKFIIFIPIFASIIYSLPCFAHGDSAEEFCLPFLSYAIYIGIRSIKNNIKIKNIEYIIIGITAACVLWIKFTMVGFYIGWIILPVIIAVKSKGFKCLLKIFLLVASGVIVCTLPVFIYFYINNAINDCVKVYFYNNIFLYGGENNSIFIVNLLRNLFVSIFTSGLLYIMLGFGIFLIKSTKNKLERLQIILPFITLVSFIFIGSKAYIYYSFILSSFAIFGFIAICKFLYNIKLSKILMIAVYSVCLVVTVLISSNTYMILFQKQDLPQYKFKDYISKYENPTLLNYGFLDGGYYTVCDIVPNCKFFCSLNINLPEMTEMQDDYVNNGKVDFIVTRDLEKNFDLYICVAEEKYYFENDEHIDRLYVLKDINSYL